MYVRTYILCTRTIITRGYHSVRNVYMRISQDTVIYVRRHWTAHIPTVEWNVQYSNTRIPEQPQRPLQEHNCRKLIPIDIRMHTEERTYVRVQDCTCTHAPVADTTCCTSTHFTPKRQKCQGSRKTVSLTMIKITSLNRAAVDK